MAKVADDEAVLLAREGLVACLSHIGQEAAALSSQAYRHTAFSSAPALGMCIQRILQPTLQPRLARLIRAQ